MGKTRSLIPFVYIAFSDTKTSTACSQTGARFVVGGMFLKATIGRTVITEHGRRKVILVCESGVFVTGGVALFRLGCIFFSSPFKLVMAVRPAMVRIAAQMRLPALRVGCVS